MPNSDAKPGAFSRGPSLRKRLTLWAAGIALIVQVVVQTFLVWSSYQNFQDQYQGRIRTRIETVSRGIQDAFPPSAEALESAFKDQLTFVDPRELSIISLFDEQGRLIMTSRAPALDVVGALGRAPTLADQGVTFVAQVPNITAGIEGPARARMGVRWIEPAGRGRVLVALAISDHRYTVLMGERIWITAFSLLLGTLATGLATYIVSGFAVAPLRRLETMPASFTPEGIHKPLESLPSPAELRTFERDLLAAREQLREFVLAQERFVSNVSHELNTPIAILLTEAQTLDHSKLPEDAAMFVDSVRTEMRRLARTVEGFLTLIRLRSGRHHAKPTVCDLNDIVTDAVLACAAPAAESGVELRTRLVDDNRCTTVAGEPALLRSMTEYLVRNAIRHSKPGDTVEVDVEHRVTSCYILVRDRGEGITKEDIDRLFDRFPVNPVGPSRGAGLGLAVAQGLAELHGGSITAKNREGGGCEFNVQIPIIPESGSAPGGEPPTGGSGHAPDAAGQVAAVPIPLASDPGSPNRASRVRAVTA